MNLYLKAVMCLFCFLIGAFSQVSAQEENTKDNQKPEIPGGFMLIHGDILVPEDYNEATYSTNFWPNGIVPYEFNSNVSQTNQNVVLTAMAEWEAVANVNFVARTNESNYVHIQSSTVNNAAVGMQGGQQFINIVSWGVPYTVAHELGHCLGYWHEQSRSDRDDYVDINYDNIMAGAEDNFDIVSSADAYPKQAYGLADSLTYDFDSVMHYDDFAFCQTPCPGTTIDVLPPNDIEWQTRIGQRNHLSFLDQLTMSFLYPEANWYFVDQTHSGDEEGTFLEPYDDFTTGVDDAPDGSTLWVQPGNYVESGVFAENVIIQAPLGNVVIGSGSAFANVERPDRSTVQVSAEEVDTSSTTADGTEFTIVATIPIAYALSHNYPNPFNPTTTIEYALPEHAQVSLKIYNMLGQEMRSLVNEHQSAAYHSVVWDGTDNAGQQVSSGIYIYRLSANQFVQTMKMTLMQ